MHVSFDLDFRDVLAELRSRAFFKSAEPFGPESEVFHAKEHGYRRIDDNSFFHIMDFDARDFYSLRMIRRDFICIQVVVSGQYWRRIEDRVDNVDATSLVVSNVPLSTSEASGGTRLLGLLLACRRQHLIDGFGLLTDRIDRAHRRIFESSEGDIESLRLAPSPTVRGLVDQMIAYPHVEPLRSIYLQAKAAEIICEVVAQLNAGLGIGPLRAGLGDRRLQAIETAAAIYERETRKPPPVEQLARRVGLNRNELTKGFRDRFGTTPHAYLSAKRMQQAEVMLREGDLPISEIARRLGFEGYASFSRAFRDHFSFPPSQIKGGA